MKVFSGRRPPHPLTLVVLTLVTYVGLGLLAAALIGLFQAGDQPAWWAAALSGPLLLVSLIFLPLGQAGFIAWLLLSGLAFWWALRTLRRIARRPASPTESPQRRS